MTTPAPRSPSRSFSKPARSAADLIGYLQSVKGLSVPDVGAATVALERIGYYRLLIYMRPLQTPPPAKQFVPGTTFDDILQLYNFDRELRLLCLDGIERVEVALRAALVNELGVLHGPHYHCDAAQFRNAAAFAKVSAIATHDDVRRGPAGAHYYATYTTPAIPPIWVVTEAVTLGALSQVFSSLTTGNRKVVARRFRYDESVLGSWFGSLTLLRNLCAHHSRLWNARNPNWQVKIPKDPLVAPELAQPTTFYARAVVLQTLLLAVAPATNFAARLESLIGRHPLVALGRMGFPVDWRARE